MAHEMAGLPLGFNSVETFKMGSSGVSLIVQLTGRRAFVRVDVIVEWACRPKRRVLMPRIP